MNNKVLSRPLLRHGIITATLFLIAAACAQARLESYSGVCDPPRSGNKWLVVATYDDNGHIVHLCGINCSGIFWEDHCNYTIIGVNPNPTGGSNPNPVGDYGTVWPDGSWVQLSIADGVPTKAWGIDRDGQFWMTDNLSLD